MRTRYNRGLAVTALLLSLLLLLAACSSGSKSNDSQSSAPSGGGSSSSTKPVADLPVIDVTFSNYAVNLDNQGIMQDRIKQYIEDKFKIKLTYTTGFPEDYASKIMTSMAAGEAADLINAPLAMVQENYGRWVEEGLIVDLKAKVDAEPERYSALKLMLDHPYAQPTNKLLTGNPDAYNAVYALSNNRRTFGGIMFNGYYLKALNLQVPTTIGEFEQVLRAIKNGDPDGNGKKDTVPFTFRTYSGTNMDNTIGPFFKSNGTLPYGYYLNASGKWEDGAISDKSREIYTMLADWYKEGLIDPEVMTIPTTQPDNDFAAGKVAAVDVMAPVPGQYKYEFDLFKKKYTEATPADMPMLAAPLKGFNGEYAVDRAVPFSASMLTFIPTSTKDPDRMVDLLNWLVSDEGQTTLSYGVEGIHYTKDASGNMQWNRDEFAKEANIYFPSEPDRLQYALFRTVSNSGAAYIQIEQNGNLTEAIKNSVDLVTARYGEDPALEYAKPLYAKFMEVGYEDLPDYVGQVVYTAEEKETQQKMRDVYNVWIMKFLIGQSDIRKDWDAYVAAYKAAGADQILQSYVSQIEKLSAGQ